MASANYSVIPIISRVLSNHYEVGYDQVLQLTFFLINNKKKSAYISFFFI